MHRPVPLRLPADVIAANRSEELRAIDRAVLPPPGMKGRLKPKSRNGSRRFEGNGTWETTTPMPVSM